MIQQVNMYQTCREGLVLHSKNIILFFLFVFSSISSTCLGQNHGFPFGEVTHRDFEQHIYPLDTTANAIVLDEFGEAYIDGNDYMLVFEYHVKIKILKKDGLEKGNFEVYLSKSGRNPEFLEEVEAVTYNLQDNVIVKSKLDRKGVFTKNVNEYWDLKKFALPNVQVGSVVEVRYKLRSSHKMNFHPWEFQSDIPKLRSEYWARIPGNYLYNISLVGYLKLNKNESTLVRDCLTEGSASADCSLNKYAMKNIPAFVEEEYATVSSNFVAAINFELTEMKSFDGRVNKITKEWKDVDDELKRAQNFGAQLRKGKDIAKEIETLVKETDSDLVKAKTVYDFIKKWYRWNGFYGKGSEFGIRKAFDTKTGNVGDINLSLIAALRFAGLDVNPVLLSTRDNGIVTDLYPVLSDFNYVVAKFDHEGTTYLLDATDDFMPFGLLPLRCLNGKGRVLENKKSYWIDIVPADKGKSISLINLKIEEDGFFRGTIQNVYSGYEAAERREVVFGFPSVEEYFKNLDSKLTNIELVNSTLENFEELEHSLIENLDVEIAGNGASSAKTIFFNPFLINKWRSNPFKSNERLYPVDFGYPLEWTISVQLELPENMQLEELPDPVWLVLPGNGGRFRYQVSHLGNKVSVQYSLLISRVIFLAQEYRYLKELFSKVIQTQNIDLVFVQK